jgi:tRNA A-37 threonylcarbamoyl transferase component Bud32/AAA+ ATPase superfamily predicted ATPase
MNPYLNRVMIQDPNQFYGRQSEVRRIFSRIGGNRPQSISIVGERRIGKSSLLHYLSCREVQERYFAGSSLPVIVFLDFQQLRHFTVEEFFSLLTTRVRQVCAGIPETVTPGYRAFQSLLESFQTMNLRLVLLFDEFQGITTNSAFNIEFYSFLRSMANNYSVAYVTSSSVELQRLCYCSDISDSPFFNIFTNLHLKPFEREEALGLIEKPSEQQGCSLRRFADEILSMAGLFPFYLQIACSIYFDCWNANPDKELDRQEVKERFLEEASSHFSYFWEHTTPEAQAILERLLHEVQPRPEEAYVSQALQRNGYLIHEQEKLRIFSPVFAEYIRMITSSGGRAGRILAGAPLPEHPIEPGARVHQYLLLRKAGEGGMGIVYEAQDTTLGRKVAVKFVKPQLLQQDVARKRFLREARTAACLNHPAIASVYELFEYGKHLGLVMEWIDGVTLKQRILKNGRIKYLDLAAWMIEACDGLETAHRQGIVHRDINCNNLMINAVNRIKVTDFGLAKFYTENMLETASSVSGAGALLGTIDYMSPEQVHGGPIDARSDLFCLGVVIFEAISGVLPFRRNSALASMQATVGEPVPLLARYQVERAGEIQGMVNKLLEKSPQRRYASAAEVKAEFEKLLKSDEDRPAGRTSWRFFDAS